MQCGRYWMEFQNLRSKSNLGDPFFYPTPPPGRTPLAHLNQVCAIYEWEVDGDGNADLGLWEWK